MKRLLSTLMAFAIFPLAAAAQSSPTPRPLSFGSPPPGSVSIVFNDHRDYSKPTDLERGHVVAALVCDGTISIPLSTMFEEMGAYVSYDPANKTIQVTKPGADLKLTVDTREFILNGETHPFDAPPETFQDCILVPVRLISEAMGAYVQWVPNQHAVVVRYITGIPPPSPAPSPTSKF